MRIDQPSGRSQGPGLTLPFRNPQVRGRQVQTSSAHLYTGARFSAAQRRARRDCPERLPPRRTPELTQNRHAGPSHPDRREAGTGFRGRRERYRNARVGKRWELMARGATEELGF